MSIFDTRQIIHRTWNLFDKVRKCGKNVIPLVLMNRHINQSRCERNIMSGILCVMQKRLSSATYSYIKVKAKNTYALNSTYIKVQHHTLWYYPGEESGYLSTLTLKESSSVSVKKSFFSAVGISKLTAKSTHVLNSTYIKVQHYLMTFTN